MFIREIWGKFTSLIFWNFEISLVSIGRFQNSKKVNSVNLSQISVLNMWLLVPIGCVSRTCEQISKILELRKTLIRRIKPSLKKLPICKFYFLLNCWMVFFLLVCKKVPVPDAFFYSHSFLFFIPKTTAIAKKKILPSSESEMISKELENSHLSYFSVNLTDIFKNYRQILSKSYLQISSKIVIYRLVATHNHIHNNYFQTFWCFTKFSFPLSFPRVCQIFCKWLQLKGQ